MVEAQAVSRQIPSVAQAQGGSLEEAWNLWGEGAGCQKNVHRDHTKEGHLAEDDWRQNSLVLRS